MGRHAGIRGRRHGVRTAPEIWETFLCHLATLSAVEVSKIAGMPSGPAFQKKRKRDRDFDERATAVMNTRVIHNGGRKRITGDQWARFLARIDSTCVHNLCAEPGMPSEGAVYKRRAADPEFASALHATLRRRQWLRLRMALTTRFPNGWVAKNGARLSWFASLKTKAEKKIAPPGETFQRRLSENELYRSVIAAIPPHLNPTAKDDIAADMMLAILDGTLDLADCKKRAPEFCRQHWKLFGTFGTVSLDAPIAAGSKLTLMDTLAA